MLSLTEAAQAIGGHAHGRNADYTTVGSDSRHVLPGMLFVALKGERFDGHDYVSEILGQGAAGAVVEKHWADAHPDLPLIAVDDTRLSLGKLAAHWRSLFHMPLLGITGSNGKTTVKEMCAAILRADFGQNAVLATTGNLNNDIGLPLTLLKMRSTHRAAVIEMGMNHPGEIAYLTKIAQPTVALVNNAQRAHLAGLGTLADVAQAKGEIFAGLSSDGVAVINADDPHAKLWEKLNIDRSLLRFGFTPDAEVRGYWQTQGLGGELIMATPKGEATVQLQVPGEHNARNALAAAAACLAANVPLAAIARGLSGYTGINGRLQEKAGVSGARLIDDSYNANPDSMHAAIDVLAAVPGRRIFVMGDMGEAGATAGQLHDEVGAYARNQGIDVMLALGEMSLGAARSFGANGSHFDNVDALVAALRSQMDQDTTVLVKGSRFMRMERVVEAVVAIEEKPHAA